MSKLKKELEGLSADIAEMRVEIKKATEDREKATS